MIPNPEEKKMVSSTHGQLSPKISSSQLVKKTVTNIRSSNRTTSTKKTSSKNDISIVLNEGRTKASRRNSTGSTDGTDAEPTRKSATATSPDAAKNSRRKSLSSTVTATPANPTEKATSTRRKSLSSGLTSSSSSSPKSTTGEALKLKKKRSSRKSIKRENGDHSESSTATTKTSTTSKPKRSAPMRTRSSDKIELFPTLQVLESVLEQSKEAAPPKPTVTISNVSPKLQKKKSSLSRSKGAGARGGSITFSEVPDVKIFNGSDRSSLCTNMKNGKGKALASTIYGEYAASSSSWMADDKLFKSKIYQKRIHTAATAIQRMARGSVCLRAFAVLIVEFRRVRALNQAAACLQRALRRYARLCQAERRDAAAAIQALCRSYLARLRKRVMELERQLEYSEDQKVDQLRDVEAWKEAEKLRIQKELINEHVDEHCRHRAMARLTMDTVMELQNQNRLLKLQQDEWQRQISEMHAETQELLRVAESLRRGSEKVREAMKKVHREHAQWQELCDTYEAKVWQYQKGVAEREYFEQIEHSIKRKYETTLRQIKWVMESSLKDNSYSVTAAAGAGDFGQDEWDEEDEAIFSKYYKDINSKNNQVCGVDETETTIPTQNSSSNIEASVIQAYTEIRKAGLFDSVKEHVKRSSIA